MQHQFKAGERVKHAKKSSWGLGEVLADSTSNRVKVLFEDEGIKEFELSLANFTLVTGEEADSNYLTALVRSLYSEKNPTTGVANKKANVFTSFPKAIDVFLSYFPNGFQDEAYLEGKSNERSYKIAAHESMAQQLNQETFSKLIQDDEFNEICIRAKNVLKINLIYKFENILIGNALAKIENQKPFAEGLFDLLFSDDDMSARFERFSTMLDEINAAKWPIATLFLFVMFPDNHMFLKPQVTQNAAGVLGMDINYRSDLNWLTYKGVLELAEMIRTKLLKDGRDVLAPRDLIDVQSFIWVIAPSYYS